MDSQLKKFGGTWTFLIATTMFAACVAIGGLFFLNLQVLTEQNPMILDSVDSGKRHLVQLKHLANIHHELNYGLFVENELSDPKALEHKQQVFERHVADLKKLLVNSQEIYALNTIKEAYYSIQNEQGDSAFLETSEIYTKARNDALDAIDFLNARFNLELSGQEQFLETAVRGSTSLHQYGLLLVTLLIFASICLLFLLYRFCVSYKLVVSTLDQVETLIDQNPDAILVADYKGNFHRANRKAEQIFGYSQADILNLSVEDLIPGHLREKHIRYRSSFNNKRGTIAMMERQDLTALKKGGQAFDADISISRMSYKNSEMYCLCLRDVTRNRTLNRENHHNKHMESIGQLTAGIAHDFNNLLAVISGNSQLLDDLENNHENKEAIKKITSAVDKAKQLTQRLLAFGGKQSLQSSVVNINEIILSMNNTFKGMLPTNIKVNFNLQDDIWATRVDVKLFKDAIINLIQNAQCAMPAGGELTIFTDNKLVAGDTAEKESSGEQKLVRIAISDTGCGIPLHIQTKVFEPFFSTKGVGKGSGLGLSMVYGFVKQSNGHVTLQSEENAGTIVEVFLPVEDSQVFSESTPSEQHLVSNNDTSERKILVVEDDEEVRMILCKILSLEGIDYMEAETAEQAFEFLKSEHHFDLLFTDIMLPGGVNGIHIAKEAMKLRPSMAILFTTGYMHENDFQDLDGNEHISILYKPYRREELLSKIGELIS